MIDHAPTLDGSSLGEVAWVDPAGRPRAAGVLPLLLGGQPAVALTFDRVGLATDLATAEDVALLVREPRNTRSDWQPGGWRCRSRLVEDPEGDVWVDQLRMQELRRYPPARRYADSPLLCREHWWYLPRLIVVLEPTEALAAVPARGGPEDLLLVTAGEGRPVLGGAHADPGTLTPTWGEPPRPGAGIVLGQDATFPDLEVWDQWTREVRVGGPEPLARLEALQPLPRPGPPGPPGLAERWRRERRFSRACRRGLAAWTG